jgi:hypothetical protein
MSIKIKKELVIELPTNKLITLDVTLYIDHDAHYGADADGNRGVDAWFIDDIDYKLPTQDDYGDKLDDKEVVQLVKYIEKEIDNLDIETEVEEYYTE